MKLYRHLLVIILCLFSASAMASPADFEADYTSGCSPLVVHFHPSTACATCTYSWNFGNSTPIVGGTSVSTTYIAVGTYTVTLTVHDGATTYTQTKVITVYPSPTPSFTTDDTAVCPGSTVTFTNTSLSGVAGPMTCTWNYGDGSPMGTGSPSSHVYSTSGNYNVTLVVTNAQGCTSSLTKMAHIHVYTPPVANFNASSVSVCDPPGSITFNSTSSGTPPLSYEWTFGDGGTGIGPTPSHPYTTPGTYSVKVVVTDANGCKDSVTRANYIFVGSVTATFTAPTTACVFSNVTFPNTSSTHTSRIWNYGDGSPTDPSFNGSHTYLTTGTYTVKLIVFNGGCSDTITHVINIVTGPSGSFNISPSDPCPAPTTLTYTSTAPAGTLVSWLFDGGSPGTGTPINHTYSTNGVKTVTMILTDPVTGCKDTVVKKDTIYDMIFTATATPYHGCKPLPVTFGTTLFTSQPLSIAHPYPFPITSYTWDFADGSAPGSGATPTHVYTAVGTYTASVTAVTSNGCTITTTVQIEVGAPPVATFTATPTHICYKSTAHVDFTATVITGPVDSFVWSFGDDMGYDNTGTHSHVYSMPGVWTVTLTPYYNGCPGTPFVRTNYITIDSPKAIIAKTFNCSPPTRVTFGDSSLGDNTHLWMFGDATTSTLDNPVHDFPALSTYTVKLATYNAASGCRDTATLVLNLVKPIPDFTSVTTACRWDSVTFTSSVTGGTASVYDWYVNGIYQPLYTDPVIKYPFNVSGVYSIRLVITDQNGCKDTVTKPNYITIGKPVPNFTAVPTSGCSPLTVMFTDVSTDVTGLSLVNFRWNFGDGTSGISSSPTIAHTYTAAGVYTVADTVTDNIGCKDTTAHPAMITVWHPHAVFSASNLHPCKNTPVTFTNTTTNIVSSSWDFGDGGTSSATSPVHSYSATGSYNVTLTVTDSHGCTDVATYTSYIVVTSPNAAFTMADSVSVCAPLAVNFVNLSTGAVTYAWNFGDGNTSVVPSPNDFYTSPGVYVVRLVTTNTYGCKDTAYRSIHIFGYAGAFDYSPLSGCAPLAVHFHATLTNVPNIIWDFADGNTTTVSSVDTITHVYTLPGAYVPKLVLSDNSGCQNSSVGIDTIKVDAVYPKFTTFPNPVCLSTPFNFIDSSTSYWSPITNWTWTYDGNTSNVASPSYIINTPGTYPVTLRVENGWGCIGLVDKIMTVYPLPVVTADPDTIICVGDSARLHGYGAATYAWTADPTLLCTTCNPAYANPTTITTYTVTGTDVHGCIDTAMVTVSQKTHTTARAWGDTAVCYGVPVQVHDTGGYFYHWFPARGLSNELITDPIAKPPYTTIYMVEAREGSCIPDTDYVTITVYPLPTVEAGPDQRLLAGMTAQINATGTLIAKYAWTPSATLSCDDCPNPVASMSVMTTYNIEVSTIHDCKAYDSVKILIYCDNSQIFVPNAFTPNNDGQNDVFYPRGIGIKTIKSFRIYNRWGELLFEREGIDLNDENNAWDGSYKGGSPKPDVYVYIIDAVCFTDEQVFIKGDVTIIR